MSRQAYLSAAAEADLVEVWLFIAVARRAPESADRFILKLRRQCRMLAASIAAELRGAALECR